MNAASFAGVMAALTSASMTTNMVWDEFNDNNPTIFERMTEEEQATVNAFRKLMMKKAFETTGFENQCEITYNNNHATANYTMQESIVYRLRFDRKEEVEKDAELQKR